MESLGFFFEGNQNIKYIPQNCSAVRKILSHPYEICFRTLEIRVCGPHLVHRKHKLVAHCIRVLYTYIMHPPVTYQIDSPISQVYVGNILMYVLDLTCVTLGESNMLYEMMHLLVDCSGKTKESLINK